MKRILKILLYFILIILLTVIILAVVAKLTENRITDIALKKVSENIDAPVEIDEVTFNLIRGFPFATIELNDVTLGTPLDGTNPLLPSDTIVNIDKLYVSVKSKPLLDGIIEIVKVEIDGANIHFNIDSSGATSIDFLMSPSDTLESDTIPSKPLNLTLTDLSVKNIICHFTDDALKAKAKVELPELNVNAKMVGEQIMASAQGAVSLSNCSFENTNLFLMNQTHINFDVDYNNDSIDIRELKIDTDGAKLDVLGSVQLGEEIKTDLAISASDLIIGELIKYVPKKIVRELGITKILGTLNVQANVKGTYSEMEMPQVDMNVSLRNGQIKTQDYPTLNNVSFNGKLTNGILRNNQSTQAEFSSFHFETDQSIFDLTFSLLDLDKPKYNVKTDFQINVDDFKDFIPDSIIQSIDGEIIASLSTKGELPDSIGDDFVDYVMANSSADITLNNFNIDVDSSLSIKDFSSVFHFKPNQFKVEDLKISIPAYQVELTKASIDTKFEGSVLDPSGLDINLAAFHIQTKESRIKGSARIKNLEKPDYKIKTTLELNLAELKKFIPDTLLTSLSGGAAIKINSSGVLNLDSIADQAMDIVFKQSSFKLNLININASLPDDPLYKIESFSGNIVMKPNAISINKMTGVAGGIEFGIDSTRIENIYNTVILNKPEQLYVNTRLNLGDLDYAMFSPFMATDSIETESGSEESPDEDVEETSNFTMLIKGKASINSLLYDSILIDDISTLFNIQDSVYKIDQFKFKAFEGSMNTSVKYSLKPDNKSTLEMHNIIDKMNVKTLLTDFDDFKDYYEPAISHTNISGLFSTDLFTRIVMIGDSMVKNDMRVKGDIKLEGGGVYNFEPATNLSKFTGIKELDNIKFKTLESSIFIFKNSIYVPQTFISSTAVDITAYGMQSLGEDYEYHLEINLADLLFGKTKKELRKQAKMGDEAGKNEQNKREIVSYSLEGKNKNGFDNKTLQARMKTKIRVQETMLNLVFHPRLVNFDTKLYSDND